MPTVDEVSQDRQTYGNAPGWSSSKTTSPAASPPAPEAPPVEESLPSDEAAAPLAEEAEQTPAAAQPSEEGTPSSTLAEPVADVPFHKHPRWIERQNELARERQEKAELQRQNQLLLETMQRVAPQPQPASQPDFWEGRVNHPDPVTAQYWQGQKQMFELAVETGKQRAIAELQPVIHAGMQKLAAIDTKNFRQENPDIQPGSQEEALIIAYMEGRVDGVRHPIDSARNNAVVKRLEAENRAYKSKQALTPAKRAAAQIESSPGIPQSAGLPPKPGDWRERVGAIIDKGGSFRDAANAIFGGTRR
ncbi:MAG TPA: hypothetical protein DCP69_05280 [Candidatus Omnitrophica bacterium]|nr:hypothetical protein [Candidatus Omnitrophota bacterium]